MTTTTRPALYLAYQQGHLLAAFDFNEAIDGFEALRGDLPCATAFAAGALDWQRDRGPQTHGELVAHVESLLANPPQFSTTTCDGSKCADCRCNHLNTAGNVEGCTCGPMAAPHPWRKEELIEGFVVHGVREILAGRTGICPGFTGGQWDKLVDAVLHPGKLVAPSPSVEREKLTLWSPADNDGMARVAFRTGTTRMIAWSDGHWEVRATDGRSLTTGCAPLGTFPTLLAAAQHTADSSAEAWERYTWEGQETDKPRLFYWQQIAGDWYMHTAGDDGEPVVAVRAFVLDGGAGFEISAWGRVVEVHLKQPDIETAKLIALRDALKYYRQPIAMDSPPVAPTRAEVEAALHARVEHRSRSEHDTGDQAHWLGWTRPEWQAWCVDREVIPARPLKVHAETGEKPRRTFVLGIGVDVEEPCSNCGKAKRSHFGTARDCDAGMNSAAAPIPTPRQYSDAFLDECARWANEQNGQRADINDRARTRRALRGDCQLDTWYMAIRTRAAQLDAEAKESPRPHHADAAGRIPSMFPQHVTREGVATYPDGTVFTQVAPPIEKPLDPQPPSLLDCRGCGTRHLAPACAEQGQGMQAEERKPIGELCVAIADADLAWGRLGANFGHPLHIYSDDMEDALRRLREIAKAMS